MTFKEILEKYNFVKENYIHGSGMSIPEVIYKHKEKNIQVSVTDYYSELTINYMKVNEEYLKLGDSRRIQDYDEKERQKVFDVLEAKLKEII